MRSFVFNPAVGSRLVVNEIAFVVRRSDDTAELLLERCDSGQRVKYRLAELAQMAMAGTCKLADSEAAPVPSLPVFSLSELPSDKRDAVLRKLAYVKAALPEHPVGPKSPRLTRVVADLAARRCDPSPPSAHSVYRWLRRYVASGYDVNALALDAMTKRRRTPRVGEKVRDRIAEHLMDELGDTKGGNVHGAFDDIMEKVARELGYDGFRTKNGSTQIVRLLDSRDAADRRRKSQQ